MSINEQAITRLRKAADAVSQELEQLLERIGQSEFAYLVGDDSEMRAAISECDSASMAVSAAQSAQGIQT